MEQVCTGACIFGKCPFPECVKYQQTGRNAVQLKTDMRILTESLLPKIDPDKKGFGIAVDIGTTTVVAYLYDLEKCSCLGVQSTINPQVTLGVDVISRIKFCGDAEDGLAKMQDAIVICLNRLFEKLVQAAGLKNEDVSHVVITGNTTMLHLVSGLSPVTMGYSPFTPVSVFGCTEPASNLRLQTTAADVYLTPCISSFVGGDITSAILASGFTTGEEMCLLMDIGTNGEVALGNKNGIWATSTAAGPAFEGAEITRGMAGVPGAVNSVFIRQGKIEYTVIGGGSPNGLCGSGILDLAAIAVQTGLMDETGRILTPEEAPEGALKYLREMDGHNAIFVDDNVYLTQWDIRHIQTAKAAMAAGVLALAKSAGIGLADIRTVFIAGGFGNFMDKESAVTVGLIHRELEDKIKSIGNAAGSGAIMALLNEGYKQDSEKIAKMGEHVELGGDVYFMEKYVDCMYFE
ncbi:MAG: ASKHA domain-containing protein [Eubacteriales bacterium]